MKLASSTCAIPSTFRFPKIPLPFPSSFSSPIRWQGALSQLPIGFSAASLSSFSSDSSIDSAVEPTKQQPWQQALLVVILICFFNSVIQVGFEMIDAAAEAEGISLTTVSFKSLFGKGFIGNVPVILAKPQTFMNASGESVGAIVKYYKIPLKSSW